MCLLWLTGMRVLGREWERGREKWVTDLACRALDAGVESSGDREKLKVCKQGKCYDRASIWKINLLRGCRMEQCEEVGDVPRGKHTRSELGW